MADIVNKVYSKLIKLNKIYTERHSWQTCNSENYVYAQRLRKVVITACMLKEQH